MSTAGFVARFALNLDEGRHAQERMCAEFRPQFIVPLGGVLAVVFIASRFAVAFLMARWQLGQQDALLTGMAVGTATLALLCWVWLFRTIQVRRRFARCHLQLQGGCIQAGAPCRFTITDPDGVFLPSAQPHGRLSYEETFRRKDGRKRYRHGPYELKAPVKWHADSGRRVNTLGSKTSANTRWSVSRHASASLGASISSGASPSSVATRSSRLRRCCSRTSRTTSCGSNSVTVRLSGAITQTPRRELSINPYCLRYVRAHASRYWNSV